MLPVPSVGDQVVGGRLWTIVTQLDTLPVFLLVWIWSYREWTTPLKSPLARLFGKVAKNFDVLGGLSTQISHPGCVMADLRGILFIFYSQRKSFSEFKLLLGLNSLPQINIIREKIAKIGCWERLRSKSDRNHISWRQSLELFLSLSDHCSKFSLRSLVLFLGRKLEFCFKILKNSISKNSENYKI